MGWETSDRRSRLPSNWPAIVAGVRKRATKTSKLGIAQCEKRLPSGKRCPRLGTDCDHKTPNDDHSPGNLQWLCGHHHGKKSSEEGRQARQAFKQSKYRPREDHPGNIKP